MYCDLILFVEIGLVAIITTLTEAFRNLEVLSKMLLENDVIIYLDLLMHYAYLRLLKEIFC